MEGQFRIAGVPVGYQTLHISFVGYKDIVIPNVVVNAGKEVVLLLEMDEQVTELTAVVVKPDLEKGQALNESAVVSASTFSVEETRKFAAAVNDPARMVMSYAGVVSGNDGNNAISIRGNSPYGLQWRMEGVEIPNPNHFANVGTSGGGISILSTQLLSNSDFLTGAFPAEYGNALAGVFDLNLRRGNNEKREYTIQAGFLGTDIAAEGPLNKRTGGSYLVNYRYSTLSILNKLGVQAGQGVTNFQDLSYHVYLPTKKWGRFSWFGFGGLSDQTQKANRDSTQWTDEYLRYDNKYFSNTAAAGMRHALNFSDKTLWQSTVLFSVHDNGYAANRITDNYQSEFSYQRNYLNKRLTLSSVLNHKFSARHSLKTGFYVNRYYFSLNERYLDRIQQQIVTPLATASSANTVQAFGQWSYRLSERITTHAGSHVLFMPDNQSFSIEPRLSVRYQQSERRSLSAGYGLHSQMQPVGVYQARVQRLDGSWYQPNKHLGFNKSHHWVVAVEQRFTPWFRLRTEAYYQQLFNIAVKDNPASAVATIVSEEGYITDPMTNKGKGRNYGLELTAERFLHNNLYFLLSTSFYRATYQAMDGVWRNSRFNGKQAFSFTAGKEFQWSGNRTFGLNVRSIYTGGFWTTPIDVAASRQAGETRYIESLAFTEQLPAYFRTDLRVSLKRNRPNRTTTWALDLQNATNHKNLGGQYFDANSGTVRNWYQFPLLPVLSYRIEF